MVWRLLLESFFFSSSFLGKTKPQEEASSGSGRYWLCVLNNTCYHLKGVLVFPYTTLTLSTVPGEMAWHYNRMYPFCFLIDFYIFVLAWFISFWKQIVKKIIFSWTQQDCFFSFFVILFCIALANNIRSTVGNIRTYFNINRLICILKDNLFP